MRTLELSTRLFVINMLVTPLGWANQRELSLQELLDIGLKRNRILLQQSEEVAIANAKVNGLLQEFLPTVSLLGAAGTEHDRIPQPGDITPPLVGRDRNIYQARVQVRQNIFQGFAAVARLNARQSDRQIQERLLQSMTADERLRLTRLYFEAQLEARRLSVLEQLQRALEATNKVVQSRVAVGRGTDLELLQSQVSLSRVSPQVVQAKSRREGALLAISRSLQEPFDRPLILKDSIEGVVAKVESISLPKLEEVFAKALLSNPHVLRTEALVSAVQAGFREVNASNLPTVYLTGHGGTNSSTRDEIGTNRSFSYGVAITAEMNLFTGFSGRATRQELVARQNILSHQQALLRENLLEQLRKLYRDWESNQVEWQMLEKSLATSRTAAKRAQTLYQLGRATLSDTLLALQQAADAEVDYLQVSLDRILLVTELRGILGLQEQRQ